MKKKIQKDWFRKKTWSQHDQDDFWTHLNRSKIRSRAQYLRIQTAEIQEFNPKVAIELIKHLILNYPEPFELAQAYLQLAECYIKMEKRKEAINAFMSSFQAERDFPNVKTNAYLDFGIFIIINELKELYSDADKILDEFTTDHLFAIHKYQYNTIKAVINYEKGEIAKAQTYAQHAFHAAVQTHSGLRYHPSVGIVKKQDALLERKLHKILKD